MYLSREVDDRNHVVVRLDKDLQTGQQFEAGKVLHDRQAVAQIGYPAKGTGRTLTFALVAVEEGDLGTLHSSRSVKSVVLVISKRKREGKEGKERERKKK